MAHNGTGRYADGAALCAEVEEQGNILRITGEDVRRAEGTYGKLGSTVNVALVQWLENQGMGVLGGELPRYQHEELVVYRLGTKMHQAIKAIEAPSEAGDKVLRDHLSDDRAHEKLTRIRGILADD